MTTTTPIRKGRKLKTLNTWQAKLDGIINLPVRGESCIYHFCFCSLLFIFDLFVFLCLFIFFPIFEVIFECKSTWLSSDKTFHIYSLAIKKWIQTYYIYMYLIMEHNILTFQSSDSKFVHLCVVVFLHICTIALSWCVDCVCLYLSCVRLVNITKQFQLPKIHLPFPVSCNPSKSTERSRDWIIKMPSEHQERYSSPGNCSYNAMKGQD